MWGQVCSFLGGEKNVGIIPMRVGTSISFAYFHNILRDHPHACGDKRYGQCVFLLRLGSSPCVWGQVEDKNSVKVFDGIIPMRVGTRGNRRFYPVVVQDHPHACGDKFYSVKNCTLCSGSSPCVWGQAATQSRFTDRARIIPMRVGTRLKKSRKIAVLQNQPLRFPLTFHRSFV